MTMTLNEEDLRDDGVYRRNLLSEARKWRKSMTWVGTAAVVVALLNVIPGLSEIRF